MIVTDIQKVPRKNKFDVYVDGEMSFTLSDVGIINGCIRIGKELDDNFFNVRLRELINADVFETLLNILGQTALTEYVAGQKLKQKGFDDESIDFAISKAKYYGYINDRQFAESYVSSCRSRSKMRIIADLLKKGISKDCYGDILDDYDENEACVNAMRSSVKCKLDDDQRQKLYSRFYSQGFPLGVIKTAYDVLLDEIGEN